MAPRKRTPRPAAKRSAKRPPPSRLWRFLNCPLASDAQARALWRQRQLEGSLGGPREAGRLLHSSWIITKPVGSVLVRHYKENELDMLRRDVEESANYGWVAETLAAQPGHINIGRTALRLALGVGLIFGASRKKGEAAVKFTRVREVPLRPPPPHQAPRDEPKSET